VLWRPLDAAQRAADVLTSRSAYEQLRAAERDTFVTPLATHGYVNPAKFQLIVEELTRLGRLLRDGKVLLDPSYVAGVTALHKPADAGSLLTFLGMIGWLAGNVPGLAEIRQPLVDVLAEAGQRAPNKSKRARWQACR
jgi:hypothetical protein